MKKSQRRASGFTLVEVLIVVVIMAILAATIIPQFSNSTSDAKINTCKFNVNTIRSQIELFKSQHDGKLPTGTLIEVTSKTDRTGAIGTSTLFAAWNAAIYVAQIEDQRLSEVVKNDRYLEMTQEVLQQRGGLWFNDESFVISRRAS